ncbi:MAG: type II 3-dehydroquinate dehydratase [Candidatus Eiseniibacteriota bacterium]
MRRLLILNGPNLNLLGEREPAIYGETTLAAAIERARATAARLEFEIEDLQTNHEGELIDRLHAARGRFDGVILNPGGLTHTSVALRDAVAASGLPTIEVHLSNLARRESFRQSSLVTGVAVGLIAGFGAAGYSLAVHAFSHYLETSSGSSAPRPGGMHNRGA